MAGLPKAGVELVAEGAQAFAGDLGAGEKAVKSFVDVAEQGGKGVNAFGEIAKGALRSVGTAAVDFAAQGVKAIGGFFVDSVKQAGDFEAGMNRFASVTGSAIAEAGMELSDFSDLFLQLGADTQFSAAQAQEAAVNLAKGGLDPATIAGGALADTLTLAAAGELELGAAAEITAKQLGVWASAGVTSAQVADLLAQAANASTVDVDELALGLANVGGIAKVAGLSFQETVQAMALLAPGFSSAADAGTSFKTFLTRLQPTTADATTAMANLGLLTADGTSKFYDATGSFIGMGKAADLLKGSLEGMSEADKLANLQAVFGQDAFRAAALIAEQGAAGYDKMGAAMTGAGTAAEQAAQRNQGFAFALESMMGSVDTFKIVLGTALLPLLTSLINDALIPGINAVMTWSQSILGAADPMAALVASINSVLPGFASFVAFVQGAIDATQPLIDLMGANLVPILAAVATVLGGALLVALGGVVAGFVAVAAPVAAAVAALAILYANIGPIQDALKRFGDTEWGQALQRGAAVAGEYFAGPFVSQVSGGVSAVQSSLNTLATSSWGQDFQRGAQVAGNYFAGPFASELTAGVGVVQGKLQELGASTWWQALSQGAQVVANLFVSSMTLIVTTVSNSLQQVTGFAQSHAAEFQAIISGAWNAVVALVTTGTQVMLGVVKAAMQALEGDWSGAWNTIKSTTSTLVTGVVTVIRSTLGTLPAIVKTTFDGIVSMLAGLVGQFSKAGADMINGLANGIKGAASSAINAAVGVAKGALQAAKDALGMQSPSRVTAEEIGVPFVQGIAQGISDSAHLLQSMAKELSKNLTEIMKNVALAAVKSFREVLQAGLQAEVDLNTQDLGNIDTLSDIAGDSKDTDSAKKEYEQSLDDRAAADKKYATDRAAAERQRVNDHVASQEQLADKVSALRQKAADEEAESAAKIAELQRQRDEKIAEVNASTDFDANKQKKIAEINADYDPKIEKERVSSAQTLRDINAAIAKEQVDALVRQAQIEGEFFKRQNADREAYQAQRAADLEEQARLQTELNRLQSVQAARMKIAADAAAQLAAAEAASEKLRATNATAAAQQFALASKQIAEQARLQVELAEAQSRGDTAEVAILQEKIRITTQLHKAQQALLEQQQATAASPLDDTLKSLAELQTALKREVELDTYRAKMTRDKGKKADREAEAQRSQAALDKINALIAQVQAGVGAGTGAAITATLQSALDQAVQQAQDILGIHSPSTVFAKKVGEPAGLGVVEGFASMLPQMANVLASSVSAPQMSKQLQTTPYVNSRSYTDTSTTNVPMSINTNVSEARLEVLINRVLDRRTNRANGIKATGGYS